jgi:dTDP-4-amino-4,6-dideoxygalactose transaminase
VYHERFEALAARGSIQRPYVPPDCEHNAHMYYVLLPDRDARDGVIDHLRSREIQAVFHYVPLHSSTAGRRYGRAAGDLAVTDDASDRLVRLPMWFGMTEADVDRVVAAVAEALP